MEFSTGWSSEVEQRNLLKLIVAAHRPLAVQIASKAKSYLSLNHWMFYLQTSSNASVRLNMEDAFKKGIRDKSGHEGILKAGTQKYHLSSDVVKHIEVGLTRSNITVKEILSVIQEKGYQNYDFNSNGEGCRYWVKKVLELFKEKTLVSNISLAIQKAFDKNGKRTTGKSIESGTFHQS